MRESRRTSPCGRCSSAPVSDAVCHAAVERAAGATKPRPELLSTLAKKLHVPVEFFAAGRPLGRLDAANAHFRSLRSTRAKDRAKAAAHAEQVWELTYALEKQVRFPDVDLPELPQGATPVEAASTCTWQARSK